MMNKLRSVTWATVFIVEMMESPRAIAPEMMTAAVGVPREPIFERIAGKEWSLAIPNNILELTTSRISAVLAVANNAMREKSRSALGMTEDTARVNGAVEDESFSQPTVFTAEKLTRR